MAYHFTCTKLGTMTTHAWGRARTIVQKDLDAGEYRVRLSYMRDSDDRWTVYEPADYFTDDDMDALGTGQHMVAKFIPQNAR